MNHLKHINENASQSYDISDLYVVVDQSNDIKTNAFTSKTEADDVCKDMNTTWNQEINTGNNKFDIYFCMSIKDAIQAKIDQENQYWSELDAGADL